MFKRIHEIISNEYMFVNMIYSKQFQEFNVLSYLDAFQLKQLKRVFDIPDPGAEDGDLYFEWRESKCISL